MRFLAVHFQRHALFYAIACGMGLQGFFTGFYDNFWPIEPADMVKLGWWQITAALFKSFSFAIGIVVGYLVKGPSSSPAAPAAPAEPTKPN